MAAPTDRGSRTALRGGEDRIQTGLLDSETQTLKNLGSTITQYDI